MARFDKDAKPQQKPQEKPIPVDRPREEEEQAIVKPAETQINDVDTLLQSQAEQRNPDPNINVPMPGAEDMQKDRPHPKDELLNNHTSRIGNKRQFQTDLLCRALGARTYMLNVEKKWATDPLGQPSNIQYSREFPEINVLFDKFVSEPPEALVSLKRRLAHDHKFIYIFETPVSLLTHDRLTQLLNEQKPLSEKWREEEEKVTAAAKAEQREEFKRRFGHYPK